MRLPTSTHRTHGILAGKGRIVNRPLPKLNRAGTPGGDILARQRSVLCDSYGDKEGSDHLFSSLR